MEIKNRYFEYSGKACKILGINSDELKEKIESMKVNSTFEINSHVLKLTKISKENYGVVYSIRISNEGKTLMNCPITLTKPKKERY